MKKDIKNNIKPVMLTPRDILEVGKENKKEVKVKVKVKQPIWANKKRG